MTTWTTRTLLYSFWWPEVEAAAYQGGFFHGRGLTPEKRRIYAVLLYRCYYFADPCCGPGRGPCRMGRGQSAGGLRLGQRCGQVAGHQALDTQLVAKTKQKVL